MFSVRSEIFVMTGMRRVIYIFNCCQKLRTFDERHTAVLHTYIEHVNVNSVLVRTIVVAV